MTVAKLVQEIFDEPDFENHGSLSDFKVIEILRKSDKIGEVKRTNYFKTLEELDLHLRNIRKGYHTFEFRPRF